MAQVQLKDVRLSFPDLWKPGKPVNPTDTPKFGGQFIIEPGSQNEKIIKEAMIAEAQATFGANWQAIVGAMEKSKKCFRKGDENLDNSGAIRLGYAGKMYIVARNKAKPAIVGAKAKKPDGSWNYLTEADGKPYGGCYVNVKLNIKAMKAKEQIPNQIYATLEAVQFVRDGESFGAGPGNPEGFEDENDDAAIPDGDGGLFD